jgi:death on curing protein
VNPQFLSVEDVLLIHEEQLARYGGGAGIRDQALLESAVATPEASFDGEFVHEDLFAMAAAYALHIAQISRSWTETSGAASSPRSPSCA